MIDIKTTPPPLSLTCVNFENDTYYTAEGWMAMVLQHAKDMAANFGGGKKIKDCVLTVSTSSTQHMREMLSITSTRRRRVQRARIRMGSNIFVLWHDCVSRRGRSKKFSLRTVGFL
jgi:molecular chaperone DnaK (HSP70)